MFSGQNAQNRLCILETSRGGLVYLDVQKELEFVRRRGEGKRHFSGEFIILKIKYGNVGWYFYVTEKPE